MVIICVKKSDSIVKPVPTRNGNLQFSIHKAPPKTAIMTAEIWFIVKLTAVEELGKYRFAILPDAWIIIVILVISIVYGEYN